jgi:hypothetical protein
MAQLTSPTAPANDTPALLRRQRDLPPNRWQVLIKIALSLKSLPGLVEPGGATLKARR